MHTISNLTRSLNCLARGWMSRERNKLEEVQLETGRIVSRPIHFSSIDSLYFEAKWQPF